jgi:hypothetical protein
MGNFVQAAGIVVAPQLTERVLIKPAQDVTQFLMIACPCCEALTIGLAKRAYERVAVLSADLAMLVTVAIVQSAFVHGISFSYTGRHSLGDKVFEPDRFD